MVDTVLSKLSEFHQRKAPEPGTHAPIQSGSLHHVPGSTKLVVILPYWHSKPSRFTAYRQRLHKRGISTLYYDVAPYMLQANVHQVLYNFTLAADAMCDEITSIQDTFKLTELELTAFSLGNTYVGLLVSKLQKVHTLNLVVPGDNLGSCLWRGIATKRIRKGFEEQGVSETALNEAWQPLALISYAGLFTEKVDHIFITLAQADKFIPFNRGMNFVEEMRSKGADLQLEVWRGGHVAAVARYLRTK